MTNTLRVFARCAVASMILVAASVPALGQAVRERELKPSFDFTLIEIPVEVVSIRLSGEEAAPGRKIKAGDDWLRGVSFKLKNVSDKPIAYVAITLLFSDPEDSTRPERAVGYSLSYGPDITSQKTPLRKNAPKAIQPGETVDLVLSHEKYPVFLNILAYGGMTPDVATAKYYVHTVAFENEPDTVWRQGNLLRRDSHDRNKFNVVGRYALPERQQ